MMKFNEGKGLVTSAESLNEVDRSENDYHVH